MKRSSLSGHDNTSRSDNQDKLKAEIRDHFNRIAPDYDQYKVKSQYYYQQLQELLLQLLPQADQMNILEIGCGTGALLSALEPEKGMGVDISRKMIEIAQKRWDNREELSFIVDEAEKMTLSGSWDAVIMIDVLEHLYDVAAAIQNLGDQLTNNTHLIIIWANRLWTPALHLLEFFGMKMPEGPHKWESINTIHRLLNKNGFDIEETGTRCLVPARLPLADWINRNYYLYFGLRKLGLIQYLVATKNQ